MPSIKNCLTAVAGVLLLTAVTQLVGCSGSTTPTAPTSAAPTSLALPLTDNGRVSALSSSSVSSITFVSDSVDSDSVDSAVHGSEAQLTSFDGSVLAFNTTKGSFSATFDSSTVFRNAHIAKYIPTDPCRQFAIDYNTAGSSVDAGGLFAAITSMASNGCLARVRRENTKTSPVDPCKSFRPLPSN